jgi:hypothetical protein
MFEVETLEAESGAGAVNSCDVPGGLVQPVEIVLLLSLHFARPGALGYLPPFLDEPAHLG